MSTTIEILPQDLPDWMRRARQGIDWGLLLVVGFSLTIAMPFFAQSDLPHTNASENYVYRASDYAAALREGRLYPRWSANAFGGYGAPIPEYYPPGAGYLSALIEVLFTDDPILAVRLVYIAAFAMAGGMLYSFVMRHAGGAAGLLAGMLYVYSPYIGLTSPYILGDLPGMMSFALMPMLMWSVDRLIVRNRPFDSLLVALSTSALYLTSVEAAIVSSALTLILVIWHWRVGSYKIRPLLVIGSYLLGIGIASFYWIPALLEQDAIHWRPATVSTNFALRFDSLFAPLRQIDRGEMVHSPQLTLGICVLGFAMAGALSVMRFRMRVQFQALFLGIGIALIVTAPFLFPGDIWLSGVIALCLAIGSSAIMQWREPLSKRWRRLFLPSLLILIWVLSSPVWLPPITSEPFGDTDARAQVEYEQQGYGIAVLPPGEPIPSSIPDALPPDRFLQDGYQSNNINKIAPGQFTSTTQAGLLDHNSHSDHFQIRTNAPITLDILTAFFPGWQATLSDRLLALSQNPDTGLMRVDLPTRTSGELVISLESTPIRIAAWIISWDILGIALITTWGRYRRHRDRFEDLEQLTYDEARLLAFVLGSLAVITFFLNYPGFPFSLRLRSGYELQNSTLTQSRTDTGLSLLSFRLDDNQYQPGDTVHLTLYWQAQRFLFQNYRVQLHLVNNRDGSIWNQTEWHYASNYPTRRWKTGLYVTDDYHLSLPANMTRGNYQIAINVSDCKPDCASGDQVTFFNINGEVLGSDLILPTLISVSA